MSKVICDVCGTSYPDTATQCPICGCVSTAATPGASGEAAAGAGYTYVKGGRFSKSNVRKRNLANGVVPSADQEDGYEGTRSSKEDNRGLSIVAIVLFLAIIAVVLYITISVLSVNKDNEQDLGNSDPIQQEQEETVDCERIYFDLEAVTLSEEGATEKLIVTKEPDDCTEPLGQVESEDTKVVTVKLEGNVVTITAVCEGETVVKLTCGSATATCKVKCSFEKTLTLPEKIELTKEGQKADIYPDDILRTEIEWESDDEDVATVKDGTVTAEGEGETVIRATYKDQVAECKVVCKFTEDETEENEGTNNDVVNGTGGVTEDGGGSGGSYALRNVLGANNTEITLPVNNAAPFELVDENGNRVSGVTWTSSDSNCCTVSDGTITAKQSGTVTITATYGGQSYSCKVIVP